MTQLPSHHRISEVLFFIAWKLPAIARVSPAHNHSRFDLPIHAVLWFFEEEQDKGIYCSETELANATYSRSL